MVLAWLSRLGISLETDAARFATRAGARPVGWEPGAQVGSIIYRLPADPMERASLFAKEQRIRVSEGEVAVLLKDGVLQGVMEPGVYRSEKARLLGDIDVIWIKTGPRVIRWGVGNVMSTDGIQVAANGTLSVAVADGAVFNSEVVQGALTLPETDLQRILLPGVQGILRSMLAKADAVQLLGERDVFVSAISTGLGEHLGTLGIGLRSFEVAEFTLPPEFREAMASGAIATARGRGEMVQARTEAEKRVLAAQADAAAMLLTGDARTKVFQQLQSAGIDPMSLEAIDVLKRYAENPSAGILGGDAVKAGLIGSITAAAIDANAAVHAASRAANFDSLRQIGNGPLVTPLNQNNAQVENAAANDAPAGPDTHAGLEKQLDALTERLANGELSEALYTKLASRIEAKIATLGESAS